MLSSFETRTVYPKEQVGLVVFREINSDSWFAERLEINLAQSQSQVRFVVPQPLDQAFMPEFCKAIRGYLPDPSNTDMLADSSTTIDMPNLSLAGIRVTSQIMATGRQRVWVRFSRAIGSVQSMLWERHRTEAIADVDLDAVAASTLLDILRPCLDLVSVDVGQAASMPARAHVEARLRSLHEKKLDMELYATLLSRYLSGVRLGQDPVPLSRAVRQNVSSGSSSMDCDNGEEVSAPACA